VRDTILSLLQNRISPKPDAPSVWTVLADTRRGRRDPSAVEALDVTLKDVDAPLFAATVTQSFPEHPGLSVSFLFPRRAGLTVRRFFQIPIAPRESARVRASVPLTF